MSSACRLPGMATSHVSPAPAQCCAHWKTLTGFGTRGRVPGADEFDASNPQCEHQVSELDREFVEFDLIADGCTLKHHGLQVCVGHRPPPEVADVNQPTFKRGMIYGVEQAGARGRIPSRIGPIVTRDALPAVDGRPTRRPPPGTSELRRAPDLSLVDRSTPELQGAEVRGRRPRRHAGGDLVPEARSSRIPAGVSDGRPAGARGAWTRPARVRRSNSSASASPEASVPRRRLACRCT